jgi:hypothetical protein
MWPCGQRKEPYLWLLVSPGPLLCQRMSVTVGVRDLPQTWAINWFIFDPHVSVKLARDSQPKVASPELLSPVLYHSFLGIWGFRHLGRS